MIDKSTHAVSTLQMRNRSAQILLDLPTTVTEAFTNKIAIPELNTRAASAVNKWSIYQISIALI